MPSAPPTNRPQTIKQAKAAYKSRGAPSLTDKEKRQLDRAIELDRRAWRSKEADKKKAEAAKIRLEKQKAELERVRLGSQRRCDRFGYKSSQMHLGAFLNKKRTTFDDQKENIHELPVQNEGDSFEDDDLDDETLLDAMTETEITISLTTHTSNLPARTIRQFTRTDSLPHNITSSYTETADISAPEMTDFEFLWEDLDSSTQIARDIASEESQSGAIKPTSKASSFSSEDFDLTIEDMDQLDPPPPLPSKLEHDRKLMPPPPLPLLHAPPTEEFTMSELEQFMDDDIQLTQAEPA